MRATAAARTGILLCNLGTPDAPTPQAVRRYLKEFLSDPRVVGIPRLAWWPILHGIILNVRPKASALKYQAIWTSEGSPLRVHTERQAKLLEGYLSRQVQRPFSVAWAMRYGRPAIATALAELRAAGCRRILAVPLYPQYAGSTTGSTSDAVERCLRAQREGPSPELRLVRSFNENTGYIAALAAAVQKHREKHGLADVLVMSFHGLPKRTHERGDPYFAECQATAVRLAQALGLKESAWRLTFQSRFGRAAWLEPYTAAVLAELGRAGRSVQVICPGFVSDCLETLEEIGLEGRALYQAAGGREFSLIPCLNEDDAWIATLAGLVREHAAGWLG
jgi:ferrochelatase